MNMNEDLRETRNIFFGGYVPANPDWYLSENDSEGKRRYTPIIAWREVTGGGFSEGALAPVLSSGVIGKTYTITGGDIVYMPNEKLHPNYDGTFKDIES